MTCRLLDAGMDAMAQAQLGPQLIRLTGGAVSASLAQVTAAALSLLEECCRFAPMPPGYPAVLRAAAEFEGTAGLLAKLNWGWLEQLYRSPARRCVEACQSGAT